MAIFVKGKKALTATLFNPIGGHTADGYYTVRPGGVMIHDGTGAPRVFIVDRTPGMPNTAFAVTAHRYNDGRVRYLHALCSADERFAGFPGSYSGDIHHAGALAALARAGAVINTNSL